MLVAWGVIRSASGSTDVGVSPLTEGGANWLAYGVSHLGPAVNSAATSPLIAGICLNRWTVDSKSMRKLRENESLYVIFEGADITGASTWDLSFALRGLTGR